MNEKHEKKQKIEPIRRVRGMQDFLPARAAGMREIARKAEEVSRLYGFERIEIPILERAGLYRRSLGLGSDVVMKEMYAFEDKNGDELCLRPEGTAGVMRMLIEQGLTQTLPQRWFYEGAMFRRERPQKGRFRQFHQCGIEMLSTRYNVMTSDLEVLKCAWHFLKELGLKDKVMLKYNWLGALEERARYNIELTQHFQQYAKDNALSLESQERLKRGNALRILDSKDPADQVAIKKAPIFNLNFSSKENLRLTEISLNNHLDVLCVRDSRLVRGLDYYSDLVYEFVEKEATREQATVLAGGRYNGLHEQIGGRAGEHPVLGVGWAAGLERLLDLSSSSSNFNSTTKNIKICLTDAFGPKFMNEVPFFVNVRVGDFESFRKKLYSSISAENTNIIFPVIMLSSDVLLGETTLKHTPEGWQEFKKVEKKEKADFLIIRSINSEISNDDTFLLFNLKEDDGFIKCDNESVIEELKKQIENFSQKNEEP